MTQKREKPRAVVTESRNWKYFTQSQLNKKLLLACTFRDASTAERAIVHGADVNCRRSDFMTPLHIAAEHDDIELVRVLCKPHDVNLEAKTMHGLTPMHTAALLGHTRVMRDLLKFGATSSCTDNLQRTPLHYAALHSNLDCARYLIKAGSGIHVYDVFQESPLHISVLKTRNLPMTKLFLAHRFRRSSFTPRDAQCLLFHAVLGARDRSDVEMIDMILHYGGSNVVNAFDPIGRRTPLHIVAMTGYYELAECAPPVLRRREAQRHFFPYTSRPYRFLIDRGADLGAKNRAEQTPMQAALNCKNLNVVRLIQDRSRAMGDG